MKYESVDTKKSSTLKISYPKDANVKTSRLNAGSDQNYRGKRGGAKMKGK